MYRQNRHRTCGHPKTEQNQCRCQFDTVYLPYPFPKMNPLIVRNRFVLVGHRGMPKDKRRDKNLRYQQHPPGRVPRIYKLHDYNDAYEHTGG